MPTRLREPFALLSLVLLSLLAGPRLHAAAAGDPGGVEKGTVISAGGVSLYVEARGGGTGTPLFVVNGGPGFDHNYVHVSQAWDVLAKDRPVVFYDQRGNGRSGALKEGQSCTVADQIADLEAVRAHVGADRIDLLGHSWGGYLVMAYAARHPEHIAHLIICDSAAPKWGDTRFLFNDVYPETVARQDALAFADALGDKPAIDQGMHEYLSMLFVSPEKRDYFLAHAAEYHYNREINRLLNADLARFDLNPELPKFHFPTLVLSGRFDANVAPSTAWKIHQAIPGSRFVVFEKSGHLPYYEEPEEFVRVVSGFLAGK
ncbi:MAG TPA: alpha/beta fold hydrolase [Thermoanaerobaculia bacterium]|nr:alpha/beta fold hydrolase [Thermoanaerobaculia bacterium]